MYKYKKNGNSKLKNIIIIMTITILTSILTILLYRMYEGININTYEPDSNGTAIRTIQTVQEVKEQTNSRCSRKCNSMCSRDIKNKKCGDNSIFKRWN